MLLAPAVVLWALLGPAPQAPPEEDPVRVTLYGSPFEATLAQLLAAPAEHVGRAVRVRGSFRAAGNDSYQICAESQCLRVQPEETLVMLLRSRAARWEGQAAEVTGVFYKPDESAGDSAFAVRFWRIATPQQAVAGPSLPGEPLTLESLVYAGGTHDGQLVRVRGRFRGRNLHGDLPAYSQRGRDDWVIKDDYYAVWVTGRAPEGSGWKLDPRSAEDTRSWVEVSGRPDTRRGFVYLRAEDVAPLAPPVAAEAVAPPPAPAASRTPPPAVVFSLPLESEELSASEARLLIQFSKHMDATSFAGRVRLRYTGEEAMLEPARLTYDASRRTLLVEAGPLAAGRAVECVLLEGIIDVHGQGLVPRQGPIVSGVVDVLRYRVASPEGGASGT